LALTANEWLLFKGIAKEAQKMCDWMKRENKLVTFSLYEPHELQEGLWIRARTLDVLISILLESSFPSKVSGKADGILLEQLQETS
jgi:hypothetical protein